MPRFLIVDDHPLFRRGVMQILSEEFQDAFCGEAGNADEALAKIRGQTWDLVLLDITMPGKNGLEVLIEARRLAPKPPVLVLTMHPESQYAKAVLRMGADGYLMKTSAPTELVGAIRRITSGGKYVSPSFAELLAWDLASQSEAPPQELLSKREFQIMCRLAAGKSATQIAKDLSLSVKTVSTFRGRILKKLKIRSNSEMTRYAIRHSLIE